MSNPAGTEFKRSKYRILGLVGQGQFGRVYCAAHRQTGRLVALKNLEHQRFPTHKFLRELRFLLSLQHPNIVTCKALEHTRTGRYLVMDYCEGGTLRHLMESDAQLHLPQTIKLVADILSGLAHAHARGIVHCDIKPENILLSVQPNGWIARISDFGIAKLNQEIGAQETGNTGSPAYMAPERFYGQYFQSSDLYSVGILLFELLTGYRPFSGTPVELMSAHLNLPVRFPETISERWHGVVRTALQKLPARRFKSAQEMLTALKDASLAEGLEIEAAPKILPLFAPTLTTHVSSFTALHQRSVLQPVTQLWVKDDGLDSPVLREGLYWTEKTNVKFHPIGATQLLQPETSNGSLKYEHMVDLGEPIQELILQPQGCFAVAQTTLYRLTTSEDTTKAIAAQALVSYHPGAHVAIEPKGRWCAVVEAQDDDQWLYIQAIHATSAPYMSPQPIALKPAKPFRQPDRVIIPDARHVVVLYRSVARSESDLSGRVLPPGETGIWLEVYNRRGDRLGHLHMPIQVQKLVFTTTPYRFLATDRCDPKSILLIDLKPYRVTRLGVNIVPHHLLATPWGYVLADTEGKILLLDDLGQPIGAITGPANPTAIASFQQRGLMITTWDGSQGQMYRVDLKQLDVDLMF